MPLENRPSWLFAGSSYDIPRGEGRFLYRLLEAVPGLLSWGTLFLFILLSWLKPAWVAFFIIFFVLYWLFRTIYLSFHLRAGYRRMREHENINWLEKLEKLEIENCALKISWKDIYHLILLPMHREPYDIVRDTFLALEKSDYPKDRMIVVLACEESVAREAAFVAKNIEQEFGGKFFRFLVTWHPSGIPQEIPGKGSNETWATKKAKEEIIDALSIPYENIIVSSFDVDTVVFPKYFSCLTYHYLAAQNPTRTSFQPIPLYINNIWVASSLSRVFAFSSTFWHTMNQERPEKLITFSSHAMSFRALVDVGFKQTNVVSDDSRIFWQCFLHYDGDYRVEPLYYPVSMDANVGKNIWETIRQLYKQQRRWAYGVADIPYFLFGFLKNKKIPLMRKFSLGFELMEGHWSWATASFLIFMLGWLPLLLGGEDFSQTLLGYHLPRMVSQVLTISMIGLITSAFLAIQLLPPRPPEYGKWKYLLLVAEWFLLPFMMIFFTALPALDAQTRLMVGKYMGFWPTPKMRKFME